MARLLLTLALGFGLSACNSVGDGTSQPSHGVEDDIRHALAQYIFENNASGLRRNADYYFLEIEKADPSAAFLNRFAGRQPAVLPASMAAKSPQSGVSHKTKGGRGLLFTIGEVDWLSDSKVRVPWGYYEGGLSASGNTATLELTDEGWKVTDDVMMWISSLGREKAPETVRVDHGVG